MAEVADAPTPSWIALAMRRDVVARALRGGALVGAILIALNQGDLILTGSVTPGVALKIALTPLVPYLVSTYSSVAAIRNPSAKPHIGKVFGSGTPDGDVAPKLLTQIS